MNQLRESKYSINFFIQGREISSSSNQFYQEAEMKNTDLVKRMIKMFVLAFCFLFIPPMLLPISYGIFHVPKPELWILPLDIK